MAREARSERAADSLQRILSSQISPFLRAKGFRRKGRTFHKWVGDNCQVINFQGSVSSDRLHHRFTINVSVFYGKLYRTLTGTDFIPEFPQESECQWRQRMGNLLPEHRDKWWTITLDDPTDVLGAELVDGLERYALPILDNRVQQEPGRPGR